MNTLKLLSDTPTPAEHASSSGMGIVIVKNKKMHQRDRLTNSMT